MTCPYCHSALAGSHFACGTLQLGAKLDRSAVCRLIVAERTLEKVQRFCERHRHPGCVMAVQDFAGKVIELLEGKQ